MVPYFVKISPLVLEKNTSLQTHGQGSRISKCDFVFNSNDLKRVSGADPVFNSNDLIRVSGADPDYDSGQRKLSSMDCYQYYYSFISVCYGGDTCSSIYKGTAVSKYCEIGGCCIPDTVTDKTDPDELCCVTTLTVILVASFVGGPVLIMTIVCSGVCIKRYCERKKNDDRVHEAENARQERRRERRRQREQQDREEEAIRIRRYYGKARHLRHCKADLTTTSSEIFWIYHSTYSLLT